jgi:hypothetical protein
MTSKAPSLSNVVVLTWCALLFVLPGGFALVTGPGTSIENKSLATVPRVTLDTVGDASLFEGLNYVLEERLGGRAAVIEIRSRIDLEVFGDSPSPQVWVGKDGWLFYEEDFSHRCDGATLVPDALRFAMGLAEDADAAGIEFLLLVAPSKAEIYPQQLDRRTARRAECAAPMSAALQGANLWDMPEFIGLWDALRSAASNEVVYHSNDTHWNDAGAYIAIKELADSLDVGLWGTSEVVRLDERTHSGDLTRLMGLDDRIPAPSLNLVRDIEVRGPDNVVDRSVVREFNATGSDPLHARHTVIVHDSFLNPVVRELARLFEHVTFIHWVLVDDESAEFIASADTLIVEVSERLFVSRLLDTTVAADLREALRSRP